MGKNPHNCKMCASIKNLIFCALILEGFSAKLPSYIKSCSLSDPKLNECALQHAIEALPAITKGDKSLKILSTAPVLVPEIILKPGNNLEIVNHNVTTDLSNLKLTSLTFDFEKKRMSCSATTDVLAFLMKYKITGQISILPVSGEGDFNVTLVNPVFHYEADFKLDKRNGEEFLKITKSKFEYSAKRVHFHFTNLFNGDERLGGQINQFVDENWVDFNKELQPAIQEATKGVVELIINGYFDKIPMNELFSP